MDKYLVQAHDERLALYEIRMRTREIDFNEIDWAVKEEISCYKEASLLEQEILASLPTLSRYDEQALERHKLLMIELAEKKGYYIASREYRQKIENLVFGEWEYHEE